MDGLMEAGQPVLHIRESHIGIHGCEMSQIL
jgi:hypothetical protein